MMLETGVRDVIIEYCRDKFNQLGTPSEFRRLSLNGDKISIPIVLSIDTHAYTENSIMSFPEDLYSELIVPISRFCMSFEPTRIGIDNSARQAGIRQLLKRESHDIPVFLSEEIKRITVYIDVNRRVSLWNTNDYVDCRAAILAPSDCLKPEESKTCMGCPKKLKCILQPSVNLGCLLR